LQEIDVSTSSGLKSDYQTNTVTRVTVTFLYDTTTTHSFYLMRSKRKHSDGDSLTFLPVETDINADVAVSQKLSNDGRCVHEDGLRVSPPSPILGKRLRGEDGLDWIGREFEMAFDSAGDEAVEEVKEVLEGKKRAKRYVKSV